MTIASDLERLALHDGVVVGRQPTLTPGDERAEQRTELPARACAQDRLARQPALGLGWRTGRDESAAVVSFVRRAFYGCGTSQTNTGDFEGLLLAYAYVRNVRSLARDAVLLEGAQRREQNTPLPRAPQPRW